MKIAVDAPVLSGNFKGGIEVYTLNLLRSLAKLDQSNSYTIYGKRFDSLSNLFPNDNFSLKCTPDLIKTSSLSVWYSWMIWNYSLFPLQLIKDNPDMFISTYPALPIYCPCYKMAVVYDITPLVLKGKEPWTYRTMFKYQITHAVKYANKIIAISEYTKHDLMDYFRIGEDRISVICCGFDNETFKVATDPNKIAQVKDKYKTGDRYILYVGGLHSKKNIDRLILAYDSLIKDKNIRPKLIIGGQRSGGDEKIFKLIEDRDLNNEILYIGFIPQDELPALISGAEVFVFPSLHEGFGIPPLEAMACGTPVIVSNLSSLPEVVGDAGILVDPYSVDEIAGAMWQVISDDNLKNDMRRKGLERASLFSWEKSARKLLELCESVYKGSKQ